MKFILATTDPQKLPVTILSRCLQFHLKHLDNQQIQTQLEKVLTEEQLAYDIKALSLIARAAEGSMRDALSLTDQAIALGNGHVEADKVAAMLGTLDTDQALMLLEAVAQKQAQVAIDTLHQLAQVGIEWDGLLRELAAQLHRIAMSQVLPESQDESSPDFERVLLLSKLMTPQDVQLCYQIALQGRQDLAFAPDGRTGLEMVLLRMLAFRPMSGAGIVPQAISVPTQELSKVLRYNQCLRRNKAWKKCKRYELKFSSLVLLLLLLRHRCHLNHLLGIKYKDILSLNRRMYHQSRCNNRHLMLLLPNLAPVVC